MRDITITRSGAQLALLRDLESSFALTAGAGIVWKTAFEDPGTLTHPPCRIIATHLINLGIFTDPATSSAWPIYFSYLPDAGSVPDNAAVSLDVAGIKDGRLMSGENIMHPGVQLVVRARDYETGWNQARLAEILSAAEQRTVSVTIGSSTYQISNVSQSSPLLPLPSEEGTKRRSLFSLNFLCTIKEL